MDDLTPDSDTLRALWTPELDPLFWPTVRPGVESAWTTHVPFAHWLVAAHRPRSILELGTHNGLSYLAFCEAVHRTRLQCRCLAVDTWEGDEHAGYYGGEVYAALRQVHDPRYASFSELLRTTFDAALGYVPDRSVDLLHVDGLHTYEAVRHDWEKWRPKLSTRGIVLFHDTNVRERGFGVWRLFAELAGEHPSFEFLHGHGLGLIGIGEEIGPELRALTALPAASVSTVRDRFAALGERWELTWQLASLRAVAAESGPAAQDQPNSLRFELNAAQAERDLLRGELERVRSDMLMLHTQAWTARADFARARRETEDAVARAERAEAEAELAHAQALSARGDAEAARRRAEAAEANGLASRRSGTGRAQTVIASLPTPVAAGLRRGWWVLTGQVQARVRARQQAAARAELVVGSGLFDPDWYLAANPDVAGRGIPAALHFATAGAQEGRDPGPRWSTHQYLERHPDARTDPEGPFLHALRHGKLEDGQSPAAPAVEPAPAPPPEPPRLPGLDDLIAVHWPHLKPLPVYAAPHPRRRLTIVTDSVSAGQLYGGVGTALILGVLAAERLDADLRLVTRQEPADTSNIGAVLRAQGVSWTGNIECLFAPRTGGPGGRDVPMAETDLLLTTSWWSTWAARQSVPNTRIAYLLQEDERMFYPHGDDHLRCSELLSDPDLFCIVNAELLLRHLQADGMARQAVAFEPAFPDLTYHPSPRPPGDKRRFFFYARPNNGRNLYWRGLEAIRAAMEEGVLAPDEWEFFFAGRDMQRVFLPGGVVPEFCENLPWPDYAALVRTVDLGLSLMYTPHPSYPPLDLAASGAVVVTNRFGSKQSLAQYSDNIICADPTVPALVDGLHQATALVHRPDQRAANYRANALLRDWRRALAPAIEALAARAGA